MSLDFSKGSVVLKFFGGREHFPVTVDSAVSVVDPRLSEVVREDVKEIGHSLMTQSSQNW